MSILQHLVQIIDDPLHGDGYQWWSGLGADVFLLTALSMFWHKHNCHVHGCWRLSWHADPDHGHPVCKRHHSDDPRDLST